MIPRYEALIRLGIVIAKKWNCTNECQFMYVPESWGNTIRVPERGTKTGEIKLELFAVNNGGKITKFLVGYYLERNTVLIREVIDTDDRA